MLQKLSRNGPLVLVCLITIVILARKQEREIKSSKRAQVQGLNYKASCADAHIFCNKIRLTATQPFTQFTVTPCRTKSVNQSVVC